MSSAATTNKIHRRPTGMRSFIAISLALHIPLFIYPILRLCDWLELSPQVTALLLVPVALSQVISRWLLRDVKQPLARACGMPRTFYLALAQFY